MDSYGIKHSNCPILDGKGKAPASVVLCSEETGTRTIVHCNGGLPELSLEDFTNRINLSNYSWIHFEVHEVLLST
jgi:ketohexokinase